MPLPSLVVLTSEQIQGRVGYIREKGSTECFGLGAAYCAVSFSFDPKHMPRGVMVLCQICHVEVNRIKGSKNLMPSVLTAPRRPPRPLQTEQQQKRHRDRLSRWRELSTDDETVDTGRGPRRRRPSRRVGASRCDRRRRAEAGAPNRSNRPTGGPSVPGAAERTLPRAGGRRRKPVPDASLRASAEGAPRPPGERGEVEEVQYPAARWDDADDGG